MAEATYSPRLRTALVLTGAGTAGAYHAGVVRALADAGVKIDIVAGHGIGALTALVAAIDGGARLWDRSPGGLWQSPRLRRAYRWRPALRAAAWAIAVASIALVVPLVALAAAAVLYAASLTAGLLNLDRVSAWLIGRYAALLDVLFHPPVIPTIVPRTIVLAVLIAIAVLAAAAVRAARHDRGWRRFRGGFWWRLIGGPIDPREPEALWLEALSTLARGAAKGDGGRPHELGRRYVDLLTDNLGQPGFRQVLIAVHDLDARRDLVAAVLGTDVRGAFTARRGDGSPREAEAIDLTGPGQAALADLARAALRLPGASTPHVVTFPAEHYWRGEAHRACDRPELPLRLIEELSALGVEQIVLVSAAAPAGLPHGLRSYAGDFRGRAGELVRAIETATFDTAVRASHLRFSGTFVIRPPHNPVGPFDFAGARDEGSDRWQGLDELMQQGQEDAFRQFIESVVASGERVDALYTERHSS